MRLSLLRSQIPFFIEGSPASPALTFLPSQLPWRKKGWTHGFEQTGLSFFHASVTPPTRVRTSSPSRSRTRDSGAGDGRSNKERQRLQPLASVARAPLLRSGEWGFYTQPLLAYSRYTHPPKPHSHPGHGTNVTPPTRVRTSSPSGSRTRDSGAGGGRSNKRTPKATASSVSR